ncbi:hypothetical protein F2P56_008549 [Juglans regia]|uniref:Uncharacterized protein LOC109012941 n=2 Tax=Juglans regia TaxID=51240 RepID=A0A2I4H2J8_JUGRE|nr:uncharacterized protein LOC109012941 [Juglans regia]KAF5471779.1 hypothetical protein F2P56_008549 [Juglans regia]
MAMDDFNRCLDNCGLLKIPSKGHKLSWCHSQEGHAQSWARLDRVVINENFLRSFPLASMEYLSRKTSYHSPMFIKGSSVDGRYGSEPFWIQNMWTHRPSFLDCVAAVWREPSLEKGFYKLASKLKKMKVALKSWHRRVFGHVNNTIKELEERIELVEDKLQMEYHKELELELLVSKAEL